MTTPTCAQVQTCAICGATFLRAEIQPFCSRKCHGASLRVPVLERFWSRVQVAGPDDCWPWTGELNNQGYGRFIIQHGPPRVRILSHRFSYSAATGEDTEGRVVRHACDNPPCCNPAHLSLGTQVDNARDAASRGRADVSGLAERRRREAARVQERVAAGVKTCCVCGTERQFDQFHRNRSTPDGRQSICKDCRSITGGVSETQRKRLLRERGRRAA